MNAKLVVNEKLRLKFIVMVLKWVEDKFIQFKCWLIEEDGIKNWT